MEASMDSALNSRDQARFVFRGTVRKVAATTVTQISAAQNVDVISVDQIIRGPDVLADFTGRNITVVLPKNRSLKEGDQEIFYTNSILLGEGLAVEAIDYEATLDSAATLAMASVQDPEERLKHHDLMARVASAELVVSGRVVETKLAEPEAEPARAAGTPATTRISEHMPLWRDAVVEVDAVHKGEHAGKTAVVRFPASTDVRWSKATKFSPGQEGFFLLHRGESKPEDRKRVAAAGLGAVTSVSEDVYTALHPLDFQPFDASDAVQQVIKG